MNENQTNEILETLRDRLGKALETVLEGQEEVLKQDLNNSDQMVGNIVEITSQTSFFSKKMVRRALIVDVIRCKNGNLLLRYIPLEEYNTVVESSQFITKIEKLGHIKQIEEIKRTLFNL